MSRHHCGAQHDDRYDELICDAAHEVVATIVHDAKGYERPPTEAQVRDLYAHLATVAVQRKDPAELVHRVLDLGWRRVVGVKDHRPPVAPAASPAQLDTTHDTKEQP